MKRDHIGRRMATFLIGLTVISFGIALITKADLGTSPITSIPYGLNLAIPSMSLGNWTIVVSIVLILLQWVLLGKEADKLNLVLQFGVSIAFGYLIDLAMLFFSWFSPDFYPMQILSVIIGCVMLAFGVYLQIVADFTMVPGDGFAYALTRRLRKNYGLVRTASDVSMVLIAVALGLMSSGTLGSVREGTLISALIVGNIARIYLTRLTGLSEFLVPTDPAPGQEPATMHA